ncbi:hypothetical protein, partial [Actinomadura sp. RB99]|uniref:hypothetical protein n=1 Tax=Actinomadura sp. RB99 TaxID=2691577 RepID=UPI0019D68035
GPLDLADVAPLEPAPALVEYVLAAAVGQPSGVASLGPDGLVPADQLPAESGGTGPAPSDAVAGETTPGQTSAAGTAATYARGDHSHGTPPLPTAAQVGADPAGTGSAAVSAHVGALDPHGDRQYAADQAAAAQTAAETHSDTALAAHTAAGNPHPGYLTTVAFGQQAVLLSGGNNPQVTDPHKPRGFARVDLNYAADGTTPDALAFYYGGSGGAGGVRTGY